MHPTTVTINSTDPRIRQRCAAQKRSAHHVDRREQRIERQRLHPNPERLRRPEDRRDEEYDLYEAHHDGWHVAIACADHSQENADPQMPLIVRMTSAGTMKMTVQPTGTWKMISTNGTITILCANTIRLRYTVRQA